MFSCLLKPPFRNPAYTATVATHVFAGLELHLPPRRTWKFVNRWNMQELMIKFWEEWDIYIYIMHISLEILIYIYIDRYLDYDYVYIYIYIYIIFHYHYIGIYIYTHRYIHIPYCIYTIKYPVAWQLPATIDFQLWRVDISHATRSWTFRRIWLNRAEKWAHNWWKTVQTYVKNRPKHV